jgi:hypothetical protein
VVAVALTWNGEETADPAVGLLTLMLVVDAGEVGGLEAAAFDGTLELPQPASRISEAERTRQIIFI